MKKCPYCGAEYQDGAAKCPACGRALTGQSAQSPVSDRSHLALGLVVGGVLGVVLALTAVLLTSRPATVPPAVPAQTVVAEEAPAATVAAEEEAPAATDVAEQVPAETIIEEAPAATVAAEEAPAATVAAEEAPAATVVAEEAPAATVAAEEAPAATVAAAEEALGDSAPETPASPEAEGAAELSPMATAEPVGSSPVSEEEPVGNGQAWDLTGEAPEHLWVRVIARVEDTPDITLYKIDGSGVAIDIEPIRAEGPAADGTTQIAWMWDVAPKWNELKDLDGDSTVFQMLAIFGEVDFVTDQPYEVFWNETDLDEAGMRERLRAEGYQFPDEMAEEEATQEAPEG